MTYKRGQAGALEALGLKEKKKPGLFAIEGPGTGALMGLAIGTSAATSARMISKVLGTDIVKITGFTLPQMVAMGGIIGAGVGSIYGATLKE